MLQAPDIKVVGEASSGAEALRQVQQRVQVFPQQVVQPRHDNGPQVVLDFVGGEPALRPHDDVHEHLRVGDLHRVYAEGSQLHHLELAVAEPDRLAGAPLHVREQLLADEIDFGFERAVETMFPALQLGQHRHVLCGEGVSAGFEYVGNFPFIYEYGILTFTDDELSTHLDFIFPHRKAVDQCIARGVLPFDDLNELTPYEIEQSHIFLLVRIIFAAKRKL